MKTTSNREHIADVFFLGKIFEDLSKMIAVKQAVYLIEKDFSIATKFIHNVEFEKSKEWLANEKKVLAILKWRRSRLVTLMTAAEDTTSTMTEPNRPRQHSKNSDLIKNIHNSLKGYDMQDVLKKLAKLTK